MKQHLYLIDDNVNGFKHVWAVLMENIHRNPFQAEQICMITHNVGKCHIKSGDIMELIELEQVLVDKGLKVELHKELLS